MSKSNTATQRTTLEIGLEKWQDFLADFTRQNRGAHARLEVIGEEVGYQVETEDRPFDGIAVDPQKDGSAVWITFGTKPSEHLTHGVHNVRTIRFLPATDEAGPVLDIAGADRTRTLLELSLPQAYALPPAGQKDGRS